MKGLTETWKCTLQVWQLPAHTRGLSRGARLGGGQIRSQVSCICFIGCCLLPPSLHVARGANCVCLCSLHLVVESTDNRSWFVYAAGSTSLLSRQTRMQKRAPGCGFYRDRRASDEPNSSSRAVAAARHNDL